MPDDFIRYMIQAVIESFPIDEVKKTDMLQSIVGQENVEGDQGRCIVVFVENK